VAVRLTPLADAGCFHSTAAPRALRTTDSLLYPGVLALAMLLLVTAIALNA